MINKHIQCATFRVVAHIKGDCVSSAPLPRASFIGRILGVAGWGVWVKV